MNQPTVYLAGPIMGCTQEEAHDWRIALANDLMIYGIKGISPLRCEPLIGKRYGNIASADPKFGTARAIGAKNMLDVQRCDMTLAYIPFPPVGSLHSFGTVTELGWAAILRKPTILVSDHAYIRDHPVIGAGAGWVLDNLDDALIVIVGVLGGYTEDGKNV